MNTKSTKTTKNSSNKNNAKEALLQIRKDIRNTVKRMSRPKGSYSEIAELNRLLSKQLVTYNRLSMKKANTVQVRVSI